MERDYETEETTSMLEEFSFKELEKRHMALTKLHVKRISTGIYGRTLLHLERITRKSKEDEAKSATKTDIYKICKMYPGDVVGVFQSGTSKKDGAEHDHHGPRHGESADGVVYKVRHDEIVISF